MVSPPRSRTVKIIATIGPASRDLETIKQMIRAGVDIVRINAAHQTIDERTELVDAIRVAAKATGQRVAILQDLAGPKPRTGPLPDGDSIPFIRETTVELVGGDFPLEPGRVSIDDPNLVHGLEAGQRVLMADGLIEMKVESCHGEIATAHVVRGGRLRGRQGVTVPGAPVRSRMLGDQEMADIAFAADRGLEYLGVSFVTRPSDIEMVRTEVRRHGGRAGIIAKIERPEALAVINEITRTADALMVARGDLGVQLPPEEVPIAQKRIIEVARIHGRPVITATQMLESMITQPIPTRAETSDVANAVLDGTDAVMLSAETATGAYPLEAVAMMGRIITVMERHFSPVERPDADKPATVASTIARAATDLARRGSLVNLIAVFTQSGYSAREVARERPGVPIMAVTTDEFVANQLALVWGVTALVAPLADDTEAAIAGMAARLMSTGHAVPGDHVLFVGSLPIFHESGWTNLLHLRQV
jgi:pyruvate kinase